MIRVYIDNDVASAITRLCTEKRPKVEKKALVQLLRWKATGQIILATSVQSEREMGRAPNQYQAGLKKGLDGLEMAKYDHKAVGSTTVTDPYRGFVSFFPLTEIVDQKLYDDLVAAGLEDDDAKHLMYAATNHYERFLTWNHKHLLNKNRKAKLEELCPSIKIQKPSELVAELGCVLGCGRPH